MTTPALAALVKAAREVDEMMRKEISHCTRYGRATEEDLDVYQRFTRLTQCVQALDAEQGAEVEVSEEEVDALHSVLTGDMYKPEFEAPWRDVLRRGIAAAMKARRK